jgi:hypothetical protein
MPQPDSLSERFDNYGALIGGIVLCGSEHRF